MCVPCARVCVYSLLCVCDVINSKPSQEGIIRKKKQGPTKDEGRFRAAPVLELQWSSTKRGSTDHRMSGEVCVCVLSCMCACVCGNSLYRKET
uniref:Putative secreted peptide n=1 Tax=Anopheles braziliensis TaxID=58242 RepID=A0A2M3ZQL4_9DIPT